MENLELQTMDDVFCEIATGEPVELDTSFESYDDIFRRMRHEAIEERSRRAAAYREGAKIYLTF